MVNLESEPQFNLFVEMALKAIADWVSRYRNAIGFDDLGMCGPDKVMRMAKEIGVTPSQLHELASNGPGNANLLKSMLLALHVDAEVLADMDPLIVRELKWLCITCGNKEQCEHELTEGTAAEHFREFCPNTVSLDDLLDQRDVMYCLQPNKRALHGHVRFGSEADMCAAIRRVRFTPNSDGESRHLPRGMSALPSKADMCGARADVCYGPIADIRAEQAS